MTLVPPTSTPVRPSPLRALGRSLALALVGGAAVAVALLAARALPTPSEVADLQRWATTTDPLLVVAVLGCALVLLAGTYLVVVGALAAVAAATRRRSVGRLVSAVALPCVRRLLGGVVGVSVGLGAVPAVATAVDVPPAVVVMEDLGPVASPPAATTVVPTAPTTLTPTTAAPPLPPLTPSIRMEPLPPRATAPAAAPAVPVPVQPGADDPARVAAPAPSAPAPPVAEEAEPVETGQGTWTIAPGQHLWLVASRTLAAAGRPTDDGSVVRYLARIVDANRDRLAVPDDPDLVFAGQDFVLPEP